MNVHYRPKAGTPRAYELLMGHIDYVTPIEAKIDEELPIGTSHGHETARTRLACGFGGLWAQGLFIFLEIDFSKSI